jgi:hypothetical protein
MMLVNNAVALAARFIRSLASQSILPLFDDAAVAVIEDYFLYTEGVIVPRNVTRVRIHHSVQHIPAYAFNNCINLVEVELHSNLRSIGMKAFRNCSSLLRINIPSSVTGIGLKAFLKCSAMVEVNLHEGLQAIGDEAFRRCSSLLRVNIPVSVIFIGNGAFYACIALVQVELHEGLQRIGDEAFLNCTSLLCIYIPSSVTAIGNQAFTHCNLLRNAAIPSTSAITQEQFARSFPTLHYKEITLELIKGRFDELPLHRLCNNFNPTHGTQAKVHARCDTFIQAVYWFPVQAFQFDDCLGMTPIHILLCSGADHDIRVIQYIIEECPDALLIQDKWGDVPLDYALLGKASSLAIIDLLFATHSKRWEALPFDFGITIERLAFHQPPQFVRDVIRIQRTHFPNLTVDWQEIVTYSISPDEDDRIFIGTFRVFVEACVSVRRYNCMSEDHRGEVDARIHEIEEDNDHDELDEDDVIHYYGEIRDMVTRFVQLHHEFLQEAGNTLVRAGMPKDAVKQVLSFL